MACGLFFATFEWVKQQGYYYFLDEVYGYQIDSSEALTRVDKDWNHSGFISHDGHHEDVLEDTAAATVSSPGELVKEKPPLLLEPIFVVTAGAAAAVVCPCSQFEKKFVYTTNNFLCSLLTGISGNRPSFI